MKRAVDSCEVELDDINKTLRAPTANVTGPGPPPCNAGRGIGAYGLGSEPKGTRMPQAVVVASQVQT